MRRVEARVGNTLGVRQVRIVNTRLWMIVELKAARAPKPMVAVRIALGQYATSLLVTASMDFATWQEMFGSGYLIGMEVIITSHRHQEILAGRAPARRVFCAAARGSAITRATCVPRIASATILRMGTTTSGFVVCRRPTDFVSGFWISEFCFLERERRRPPDSDRRKRSGREATRAKFLRIGNCKA